MSRAPDHLRTRSADVEPLRLVPSFFDRVPVGLYRTTPDGELLDANQTLADMFGYDTPASMRSRPVESLYVDPTERVRRVAELNRCDVLSGAEFEARRHDGRAFWVSDHARAVRDGNGKVICYEGILVDITERRRAEAELHDRWQRLESLVEARTGELRSAKEQVERELIERHRAEAALRTSAARFQQLFDQSPVATAIIGLDARLEHVNAAFCHVLCYAEHDLLGRALDTLVHAPRDTVGRETVPATIRLGEASELELQMHRGDGQIVWVRASTRQVQDAAGDARHYILVIEDVTERRRAAGLLKIQRDLGIALMGTSDRAEAIEVILDAALRAEAVDAGGVYVVSPITGAVELISYRGVSQEFVDAVTRLPGDSPPADLVRQARPVYASADDAQFLQDLLRREGIRSFGAIPVLHEGAAVACLNIASRSHAVLPESTCAALEAIATRIGMVLARIHDRDALLASERLFRTLAATIPALIVIVQGETFQYINDSGAQSLGYRPDEIMGRPITAFIRGDMREFIRLMTIERQAGRDAPPRYEVPVVTRDGRELWLDMSAARIEYHGRPAALGIAIDVTERRRAAEALRVTQERLALAVQGADLGVWDWNVTTGEVTYSDRWQTMLGYEAGELLGHYRTWEDLVHPEDKPRVLEVLQAHHEGRTEDYAVEMRLRCKNGDWKWVLASGKVMARNAFGHPLRMTGTHLDISASKAAAELARQHVEQLAHVSRVSTIGEMASALAHEMAQPLSAILYYTRGMHARLAAGTMKPDETRATLDKIAKQAERAGDFIRQIKAFIRNTRTSREPDDLGVAIRDALSLAEPLIRQQGIQLTMRGVRELPPVIMDRIQIEQVLLNLIRNAAEAMEDVPRPERAIEIRTSQTDDGAVRVAVHNAGPSIPSDVAARVFEPFFTTKRGGTGLGLSISRSIIEVHDGMLRLEPDPAGGTVVWFTVPTSTEPDHVEP